MSSGAKTSGGIPPSVYNGSKKNHAVRRYADKYTKAFLQARSTGGRKHRKMDKTTTIVYLPTKNNSLNREFLIVSKKYGFLWCSIEKKAKKTIIPPTEEKET